jgi:hypothetical protein
MKKFKEYTREKWEDIGLLSSTPEDRKDKVAHALNVAVKAMIENVVHSDNTQFETIPIPVIIGIVNAVDVSDEDISRMCYEIRMSYIEHDFDKDKAEHEHINLDYEAMFLCKIIEEKINYYKNK